MSPDDPQLCAQPSQGPHVTSSSSILLPSASRPTVPTPPFPSIQFPPDSLQPVSISSVRAVLEKLEINIPVDDVLTAIRDAEAKRIADRRAKLSELARMPPAPQPPNRQFFTSNNSPKPRAEISDLERRRHLCRIAKEGFPHGVPDPFVSTST